MMQERGVHTRGKDIQDPFTTAGSCARALGVRGCCGLGVCARDAVGVGQEW